MGITLSDYPVIESPAACPKCGSMDIRTPFHGRRTNLWLSTCRDCNTNLRSREQFSVERKVIPVIVTTPMEGFQKLRDVASGELQKINARDWHLRRTREPGEEG